MTEAAHFTGYDAVIDYTLAEALPPEAAFAGSVTLGLELPRHLLGTLSSADGTILHPTASRLVVRIPGHMTRGLPDPTTVWHDLVRIDGPAADRRVILVASVMFRAPLTERPS